MHYQDQIRFHEKITVRVVNHSLLRFPEITPPPLTQRFASKVRLHCIQCLWRKVKIRWKTYSHIINIYIIVFDFVFFKKRLIRLSKIIVPNKHSHRIIQYAALNPSLKPECFY
jgi:hypothetical protein